MSKGHFSDSHEDQLISPSNDYLLLIYEKMSDTYDKVKKNNLDF